MKFALVNGERREAEKGLQGTCVSCNHPMVAKCGSVKINHWSHKGKRICDPWWENETEWHRDWKAHFPTDWQEVIHFDPDTGEKHIADVKTDHGWVIEFQHSYLKSEERKSRNEFYKKIVWVVDGARLKNDAKRFKQAIEDGVPFLVNMREVFPDFCPLLKDWSDCNMPVFFDFGLSSANPEKSVLWVLMPRTNKINVHIFPYSRNDFLEVYLKGESIKALEFEKFINDWPKIVNNEARRQEVQMTREQNSKNSNITFSRRRNRL